MRIYVDHEIPSRELALEVILVARELGHEVVDPIAPGIGPSEYRKADLFVAIAAGRSNDVYFRLGVVTAEQRSVLVVARDSSDLATSAAQLPLVVVGDDTETHSDSLREALQRAEREYARSKTVTARVDVNIVDSEEGIATRVGEWFRRQGATIEHQPASTYDLVVRMPHGERVVLVQAKAGSPSARVAAKRVQQFGEDMALLGADAGLLVTASSATRAATQLAASRGVAVASVAELLKYRTLDEFEADTAPARLDSDTLIGQIEGYWFDPRDAIPARPVGRPTGAVLPVTRSSDAFDCLVLVPVDQRWLVLSEYGRHTYRHTEGMLRDEVWRFAPAPGESQHWPIVYEATYGNSLSIGELANLYGPDAAAHARADAPAVQLRLRRHN